MLRRFAAALARPARDDLDAAPAGVGALGAAWIISFGVLAGSAGAIALFGEAGAITPPRLVLALPETPAAPAPEIAAAPDTPVSVPAPTPEPDSPPAAAPGAGAIVIDGVVVADPALIEETPDGPLPKIAADGRRPDQVYARPFNMTDPRPRIALALEGAGLDRALLRTIAETLPPEVTLILTPYAADTQGVLERARAGGREVFLAIPLEPHDLAANDTGPATLLAEASWAANQRRLNWLLTRATGYAGIATMAGERFLDDPERRGALAAAAAARGLAFADLSPAAAMRLDATPGPEGFDAALIRLAERARADGAALGVARATPLSVERLTLWFEGAAARGFAPAPVSAILQRSNAMTGTADDRHAAR